MLLLLQVMNKVNADSTSPNIAGLFFTVDPERDSKEIIKAYLADFSPNLRGFTGTKEQVNSSYLPEKNLLPPFFFGETRRCHVGTN